MPSHAYTFKLMFAQTIQVTKFNSMTHKSALTQSVRYDENSGAMMSFYTLYNMHCNAANIETLRL